MTWSDVAAAPAGLDETADGSPEWLRITPRWPEIVRDRPLLTSENASSHGLLPHLALVGHGRPTADWVVGGLLDRRSSYTDELVSTVAQRMRDDWISQEVWTESVLAYFAAGRFTLTRATPTFAQIFGLGAMKTWWGPALALTEIACATSPRPAGLPGLLSMLADHVHEVPAPVVLPSAVHDLAAAKGSTRAQAEARRLVAGAS